MSKILIVDDDDNLRRSFEKTLSEEGYRVAGAPSGEKALPMVSDFSPNLVVLDVRLPGMDGLATLKAIREKDPKLPVIIMTAFSTTEAAIEATKLGAFDYVLKPFEIPQMLGLISRGLTAGRMMKTKVELNLSPDEAAAEGVMIGNSEPMRDLYKMIGRAAPTDATVLIRGESGTGKELVARALYSHSRRSEKPLQIINCVAIPETLLESELFGYEKGAFTGAVNRRIGKIEQANGGTVFLDEIGDMPMSVQSKLLRLLQERSIERLGGREPVSIDVRVLAATNRDLEKAMADGLFREDLYYRLKVVSVHIPPLRERKEDLPVLAEYFMRHRSIELGLPNPGLSREIMDVLMRHDWPGNVRELGNAIETSLICSQGQELSAAVLAAELGCRESQAEGEADQPGEEQIASWIRSNLKEPNGVRSFAALADHFASMVILEALKITGGNRTQAASLLSLSRPTIISKIDRYGLKTKVTVSREG